MRHVELHATIHGVSPAQVFTACADFGRYSQLAPHVKQTTVTATLPGPAGRSEWELFFRSGLLHWTEDEQFDTRAPSITFTQYTGDFDEFHGEWTFQADGPDVHLRFSADFDFGIPSLEGILDPIAERVIKETVAWVVVGNFPSVTLADDVQLTPSTT